jgi:dTDP-4-dehydrorhamnose reductase
MARLLVTGASGLLGANVVLEATSRHRVMAVYHRHPLREDGWQALRADLGRPQEVARLFAEWKPEWVIHCAAEADVDRCERDPERAFQLNRDMARWVAEASRAAGARLVHISTDAVFCGDGDGYREQDEPQPINLYGRSKLAGERAVAQAYPQALIVRTNFYGWGPGIKRSLAEWFLGKLRAGERCGGVVDVHVNLMLATDLASILLRMLERGLQGLYHVAGADCVSKFEFGQRIAEAFGLDGSLIEPISVADLDLAAPRPKHLCLRTERVERALGLAMPGLDEGLRKMRQQEGNGYAREIRALLQGAQVRSEAD